MAEEGKRITQLGKAAATAKQGVFAIVDPITDKTVQIEVQSALGAVRADMEWDVTIDYSIDDFVLFQGLTAWQSLQSSNVGNVPTENTFWTAIDISLADGITDTQWAAGLFTYDDSKVIHNNIQYYLQTAAPFESTDIDAEITAGDWQAGNTAINIVIQDVNTATYLVVESDLILNVLYTVTGSVIVTIPTALISNGFSKLAIKDAGGNSSVNSITIVGEGGELIDGSANIIINSNYSAANLYATNNQIYIY